MTRERPSKAKLSKLISRFTGLSFLKHTFRAWRSHRVDLDGDRPQKEFSGCDNVPIRIVCDDSVTGSDIPASNLPANEVQHRITSLTDELTLLDLGEDVLIDRFLSGDSGYLRAITKAAENQYVIQGVLGSGSFSKVKLALDKYSGRHVAIKMISLMDIQLSLRLRKTIIREIQILRTIRHPHIVSFYEVTVIGRSIGLVMEYVAAVELFQHVTETRKLSESETKCILRQLLLALEYLHSLGVAHRDLKLENILIQKTLLGPVIRLIDFGLARSFESSTGLMTTRCGSEEYAAPEVILGQPYDGRLSDLWSIGVITYACILGALPFNPDAGKPRSMIDKILNIKYQLSNEWVSANAAAFIRSLLVRDPKLRPTTTQLLRHPFLCK